MLELQQITKEFPGMSHPAVDHLGLTLHDGEIIALAGASGSGKTTALRLIAGFERPDDGALLLEGRTIADTRTVLPPERRNIGVVFQDFALFPHLTVAQNVAFGISGTPAGERAARVSDLLRLADIAELGERYPHEISGGQQQRVALVRALAPRPHIVLLDEPFSNLDHTCTHRLLAETRQIIKESGSAAVVVTHDRYEAFTLADRIAVLEDGRLQQIGTAEEIYGAPQTRHVAEFSGSASFVPAWTAETTESNAGGWLSPLGPVPDGVAVVPANGTDTGRYLAVVRPHHLRLRSTIGRDATQGDASIDSASSDAVVKDVRFLGSVLAVRVQVEWPSSHSAADGWDAARDELLAHIDGTPPAVRAGARVTVEWD